MGLIFLSFFPASNVKDIYLYNFMCQTSDLYLIIFLLLEDMQPKKYETTIGSKKVMAAVKVLPNNK